MKTTLVGSTLALALVLPGLASAQDAVGAPTDPSQGPIMAPAPVAEGGSEARFRWGIGAAGGLFIPGSLVDFGAGLRLGAQLNDSFGVYGDLGFAFGLALGGSVSGTSTTLRASAVAFWHVGVLAEATFGDMFFVGAGPLIASGGWVFTDQYTDSSGTVQQNVIEAGGFMPGLDLRVGIGLGGRRPSGRRSQFTIGLDVKFLLASVSSASTGTGTGATVRTGDTQIGITPMLMIGYDSK